ncbi:hypothetical protein AVEN_6459-1 [Araneus ventricosus]|uniref:PiggyBac transposable element-derived protein domain-containing protein n=1 Tax=Araneus ventricosus TaxID=182803 RepID=A0A4Y2SIK1_ARAVE|nr:hypothetical protein AVEN_6459-1 [Araneus ventricosus]
MHIFMAMRVNQLYRFAEITRKVHTMKRTRKEVPESFKLIKIELYSSKVLKHDNITLSEYKGKKSKNVLLESTLHPTVEVEFNEKKTPEANKFYN